MSQDIFVVVEHLRGQVADISYVMLAAGRALAQGTGGKVVAALLGHNAQDLAKGLAADEVLYLDHASLAEFTPDAYQAALATLIKDQSPRAVLLGSTSIGSDIASSLSAQLGLPLISACLRVSPDGKLTSQICGGKILAETALPDSPALVTMIPGGYPPEDGQAKEAPPITPVAVTPLEDVRITLKQYIEPELGDVDISREAVLVAIGRGIQQEGNVELAEALASALGGAVCASRPVVDQGWLPTSRLVGKSGKYVKPKLYLTLGISGAPEHVEAVTGSDTILAINTDPAAPIFDIAKYGTLVDLFDLVPVLTEKIQAAKG
jgi:electron transfer flavoprotein alpha subunit